VKAGDGGAGAGCAGYRAFGVPVRAAMRVVRNENAMLDQHGLVSRRKRIRWVAL
jgi:hypothetical protein